MSSLFELVVDGITSFFSSGIDEKAEGEKKKKKSVTATLLICWTRLERFLHLLRVRLDQDETRKRRAR
jgi:hypothetical protein